MSEQQKQGRLLWVGDAAVSTGFARITHETLAVLQETWDVHALGINYSGDPHDLPYPVYPANNQRGTDPFGVTRTAIMATRLKPDVIILLNDPWNIPAYLAKTGNAPVIASVAVDGKNCRGRGMNGLAACVFWTEFGRREAQAGGYSGPTAVIPLGVDLEVFKPGDKAEARGALGLPPKLQREGFIVGNVNRNHPRKRMDLTIQYFAEWIRGNKIGDAYLYMHANPTGGMGFDLNQLAKYYGVASRLIFAEPEVARGVPESFMAKTYQAFDAMLTTTQGEGFGLPTLEGMACGVPQIVPDWAALGEICEDAALMVPCTSNACTPNGINAVGGVPDRDETIACLDRMYREPALREDLAGRGILTAGRDCYRWRNIGERFGRVIDEALDPSMRARTSSGGGENETDRQQEDGGAA